MSDMGAATQGAIHNGKEEKGREEVHQEEVFQVERQEVAEEEGLGEEVDKEEGQQEGQEADQAGHGKRRLPGADPLLTVGPIDTKITGWLRVDAQPTGLFFDG